MPVVASQFFSDADRVDRGCCKVTAMVRYVRQANTKQWRMRSVATIVLLLHLELLFD